MFSNTFKRSREQSQAQSSKKKNGSSHSDDEVEVKKIRREDHEYRKENRNDSRIEERRDDRRDQRKGDRKEDRTDEKKSKQESENQEEGLKEEEMVITVNKNLKIYKTFESMKLKEDLLRGIYSYGFERPSAIQQRAIVPIIQGRDTIAQSQSGTGKTAVFSISILQILDLPTNTSSFSSNSHTNPQALIISPTRELAEQSARVIHQLGDYMNIRVHACVGGKSIGEDIKRLSQGGTNYLKKEKNSSSSYSSNKKGGGVHVVSGTPGRVLELIEKNNLVTKNIKILVIDEADEILTKGFQQSILSIYRYLPPSIQVVMISATLTNEVNLMIDKLMMNDPIKILVKRDELTLEGIQQYYINVEKEEYKYETLCDLYNNLTITQSVIFVNTRKKCEWLYQKLKSLNYSVLHLHGEMNQADRENCMTNFRSGSARILITTDIWGRGLDVQQVSLVFNYDLPLVKEQYLHRIGRSGRFGRKGVAINLIRDEDSKDFKDLQYFYSTKIKELPSNVADLL